MAKLQSIEQFFEETPKYPIFTKTKKLLSFLDNFTISIELSKYRKKIYNIRKHILMIENHINDSFLRKSDDEVVADINFALEKLFSFKLFSVIQYALSLVYIFCINEGNGPALFGLDVIISKLGAVGAL